MKKVRNYPAIWSWQIGYKYLWQFLPANARLYSTSQLYSRELFTSVLLLTSFEVSVIFIDLWRLLDGFVVGILVQTYAYEISPSKLSYGLTYSPTDVGRVTELTNSSKWAWTILCFQSLLGFWQMKIRLDITIMVNLSFPYTSFGIEDLAYSRSLYAQQSYRSLSCTADKVKVMNIKLAYSESFDWEQHRDDYITYSNILNKWIK